MQAGHSAKWRYRAKKIFPCSTEMLSCESLMTLLRGALLITRELVDEACPYQKCLFRCCLSLSAGGVQSTLG